MSQNAINAELRSLLSNREGKSQDPELRNKNVILLFKTVGLRPANSPQKYAMDRRYSLRVSYTDRMRNMNAQLRSSDAYSMSGVCCV